ncbi:hypothetical protein GCM10020218_067970 [Dactylosporangium vinaceum]
MERRGVDRGAAVVSSTGIVDIGSVNRHSSLSLDGVSIGDLHCHNAASGMTPNPGGLPAVAAVGGL